jgi:predicted porin
MCGPYAMAIRPFMTIKPLKIELYALAACLVGLVPASAFAADLGANCCTDLEERVVELEAMSARKGNRKVSLTISGLVTWPVMVWNDGEKRDAYVVSNEVKRPRLRFSGEAKIDAEWSAGFALEIGPNPSPFAPMDQFDYDPSSELLETRHSNWFVKNKSLGQITMGQGSQASDTVTEVTLANTTSVMSPGLPILLGYVTRGWFMRRQDGTLSGLRFGDFLFKGRNDVFGEGHRWNVVRYDTPAIGGFTFSGSWGEDDAQDAAVRYSGAAAGFKFAAAAGIGEWTDGGGQRGCAKAASSPDLKCWEVGGSASIMHEATGLFLNAAAGYGQDDVVRTLYGGISGVDDDETFYYFVAGIEQQWFSLGKTTLFGQYWHKDVAAGINFRGGQLDATPLGENARLSGADVSIYGVSANQTLAEGVDLYVSVNRTETQVRTSATGAVAGSTTTRIEPFTFLLAGMAVRF